jgi:hypothetical protein
VAADRWARQEVLAASQKLSGGARPISLRWNQLISKYTY